ncbi:BadF/BadG/BcrA/BcrD ATPase family protein [Leifsonia bigeumensis]|uniref:BadF/BadG/BcrA/BcrD ATPase family protein n=1 Tax=Leifsonella bigeumensis TaxID=433643 RepID=A0ABP7F469_9MICO
MTARDTPGRMTARDTLGGMVAVLAVDGGQSGIRLRHSSAPRVVEAAGVSRAGDSVTAVAETIATAWEASGFPPADRVVLGLTTAPVEPGEADRLCALVAAGTRSPEVWLADDTVTSHAGALSGAPGVSLVVGTGVACLAVPGAGQARVFDGHGYLLGDEGGAFWIGRRALGEVLRDRDRGRTSALSTRAASRYGDLDGLAIRLHDSAGPVNEIAQFAREVLDAAADGDDVAGGILDDAAARLLKTAIAAAEYLAATDPLDDAPLALGGRMLEAGSPLRTRLDALLAGHPGILPRNADAEPIDGALLLGSADSPGRYRALTHLWKDGAAA